MAHELIWMRPVVEATTGRPAELSREQITAAAIAIADADGLAAVTMRRVANELGTGAATLYRHLSTRDDLLDLMIDQAFCEYEPAPDTGDWRADLVADYLRQLALFRARPWLVDAIALRPGLGPRVVGIVEGVLTRMSGHPAPASAKMEALGTLTGIVRMHAQQERLGGVLDEDFALAQAAYLRHMTRDGSYPHLAAALTGVGLQPGDSIDDRLARILRLNLDGLLPES
ncbi:TetR/AcrR family transcriptional regulator [Pseudonocardia spinosispora]|uniref:TetR/AcrR family transcriptional regulator n=1 Tax=Pseudonocardia spinosispora TaxID=103441 RepID=UPI0004255D8A|nr:TetR/AcrR family transcriptional regulator [Pseudonocardia spinosispora]